MQRVLSSGHAIFQLPEQHGQLGTDTGNAQVEEHLLTRILDQVVDLLLGLRNDLLDESGVDSSVLDQLLHGQLRDFAAYGIEPGEDDGIGGVIDDDIDPRRHFESLDVASVAPDDASLHFIIGQGYDRRRRFRHVIQRVLLHRVRDNFPGFDLRVLAGFFDDAAGLLAGLGTCPGFDVAE